MCIRIQAAEAEPQRVAKGVSTHAQPQFIPGQLCIKHTDPLAYRSVNGSSWEDNGCGCYVGHPSSLHLTLRQGIDAGKLGGYECWVH